MSELEKLGLIVKELAEANLKYQETLADILTGLFLHDEKLNEAAARSVLNTLQLDKMMPGAAEAINKLLSDLVAGVKKVEAQLRLLKEERKRCPN